MTVEALRRRKRELSDRKRELEGGDPLALFMVNEELLEVNARLRALSPRHHIGARRVANGGYHADRKQYEEWASGESGDRGPALREAVDRGLALLSDKQRAALTLFQKGSSVTEIAQTLNVRPSTVSRLLGRARRIIREEAERCAWERCRGGVADLSDEATVQALLAALTAKQAAYLYLYYSEWLSLREIAELVGSSAPCVLRVLQRALRNIGSLLGYRETVLEHAEALDNLAYRIYCGIEDLDDIVPPALRPRKPSGARRPPPVGEGLENRPPLEFRASGGRREQVWLRRSPRSDGPCRGRLLAALLDRARASISKREAGRRVLSWLERIFAPLTGKTARAIRWFQHLRPEAGKQGKEKNP